MEVESKSQQTIDDVCEKFKNADHEAQARLLAKITDEIEQFIMGENNNSDATDGAFEVLSAIAESIKEDFEKLIDTGRDKKKFIKTLSKVFALLLNTKVNTIDKIKRILKITVETTLEIWQRPRLQ